jgi:S-adenosylmethionine hydrolase
MQKIITLTTDFGYQDHYVGTMKGVILCHNPDVAIVDLTHGVTPHSVLEANFVLRGSYHYFPAGTLHVIVVDPGVGGSRRILYVEKEGYRFLAPDNGVLTEIVESPERLISVENRGEFLESVSSTFHGRDVFAPLAAKLCAGLDPEELGPPCADPTVLDWPAPDVEKGSVVEGCVLYIDVYGNLVTNIAAWHVSDLGGEPLVFLKGDEIGTPQRSYDSTDLGRPVAIINSFGLLEIAVREGSAARAFKAGTGDEVTVAVS